MHTNVLVSNLYIDAPSQCTLRALALGAERDLYNAAQAMTMHFSRLYGKGGILLRNGCLPDLRSSRILELHMLVSQRFLQA